MPFRMASPYSCFGGKDTKKSATSIFYGKSDLNLDYHTIYVFKYYI